MITLELAPDLSVGVDADLDRVVPLHGRAEAIDNIIYDQLMQGKATEDARRQMRTFITDIAKTTVFVTDLGDFAEMNAVYAEVFGHHRPARSTVQVAALPGGAKIEIEAWAYVPAH